MTLHTVKATLEGHKCSCAAGKGMCNHVVALLYQTAHYSSMGNSSVPLPLACTSRPQEWHKPRTQVNISTGIAHFYRINKKSCAKYVFFNALHNLPPTFKGIVSEAVDQLVIKKPKTSGSAGVKSTEYMPYKGL